VYADLAAISGRLKWLGELSEDYAPAATPGYWRRHGHRKSVRNTGSPKAGSAEPMNEMFDTENANNHETAKAKVTNEAIAMRGARSAGSR
jgi:hypothetical protein